MTARAAAITIALALLAAGAAHARAPRTPAVPEAAARQHAADIGRNLGGGTTSRCVRHGRYFVKCRVELATTPRCHVWAHVHAHNGYMYWPLPRFAACDDGQLVRIG